MVTVDVASGTWRPSLPQPAIPKSALASVSICTIRERKKMGSPAEQ
jgi:hypothetical protein